VALAAPQPLPAVAHPAPRLEVPPAPVAAVLRLERELGVSHPVAQVLVRRGLADPDAARRWLAAEEAHPPSAFAGLDEAVETVERHLGDGSRITVHGDYDVDGVCSTAVLARALRRLGATVDTFIPSRSEDGYGLSLRTVERLAARGTTLLITADCGITAVDEVAAARAAGLDVVVTDHHAPRADGRLPDAPLVHPGACGYPCPDLCAAGVAYKLATALLGEEPEEDLDLVALATVCDVVALQGENRRLVRAGLEALAATAKPGLRALMRVARVDPARVDARALGFRLGPRINAAGRLRRADAALELILTDDPERARQVAEELDALNGDRRFTEQRMLFAAEAMVVEQGDRPAYVLAGDEWHAGVAGIVAGRIAERYHRPTVVVALDGASGTGSARSVPGFDLLAALDASADHLLRHGGHRAAAGLEVAREDVEGFRAAFTAHAEAALGEELRRPVARVDAVVAGDELGQALAEELEALAPFGQANPEVTLLLPAARLVDPRPMGEQRHVRFSVEAGGIRCRAVAFGTAGKLPCDASGPVDATFALELDHWGGAVQPRLVLEHAQPAAPAAIRVVGEPEAHGGAAPATLARPAAGDAWWRAAAAELDAPLVPWPPPHAALGDRPVRDRRGGGIAGTLAALAASGERVLAVCADVRIRLPGLAQRVGGFDLTSHAALERAPQLAAAYDHLVVIDPAPYAGVAAAPGPLVHLVHGEPEAELAARLLEQRDPRAEIAAAYRRLREGARPHELHADPRHVGWALRVLEELGLVRVGRDDGSVTLVPDPERTDLVRSPAFRAHQARLEHGRRFLLSLPTTRAAA